MSSGIPYNGIPAEFREFFNSAGIPLKVEFLEIRIPPELIFDGIMDTILDHGDLSENLER